MLKKKINNILFVAVVLTLNFSIKSQVLISNSGEEIIDSNNPSLGSFAFSVGEPAIETLSSNGIDNSGQGFHHPLTTHLENCSTDPQSPYPLSSNTETFNLVEFGNPAKIWKHEWRVAKIDANGNEAIVKYKKGNSPTSSNRNSYN